MTIREIIHTIQQHPVVTSSIPLEVQMGYPAFTIQNGKLCIHFLYYSTKLSDEKITLYPPRYSLKAIYPFNKIVKLEDLFYNPRYGNADFSSPIGSMEFSSDKGSAQREMADELFLLGDKLIEHYEKGTIQQTELKEYQNQLYRTLNSVYVEMYRAETE